MKRLALPLMIAAATAMLSMPADARTVRKRVVTTRTVVTVTSPPARTVYMPYVRQVPIYYPVVFRQPVYYQPEPLYYPVVYRRTYYRTRTPIWYGGGLGFGHRIGGNHFGGHHGGSRGGHGGGHHGKH